MDGATAAVSGAGTARKKSKKRAGKAGAKGRKSSGKAAGGRRGSAATGPTGTSAAALRDRVDSYRVLGVHVSFTDSSAPQSIRLLSGGQKTLVALALIFPIQRADPAPFYIIDEADSALDAVYRASVARLVQKLVRPPARRDCTLRTLTTPRIPPRSC